MTARLDVLRDRVHALLAAPADDYDSPSREEVEFTLTEGYAAALALDGERLRLTQKIEGVTADVATGESGRAEELRGLIERLEGTERDLDQLRELLAVLRGRVLQAA